MNGWPRIEAVRERGEEAVELSQPTKESKTGGWEYETYAPSSELRTLVHDYTQCRRERDRLVDGLREEIKRLAQMAADEDDAGGDPLLVGAAEEGADKLKSLLSSLEEQSSKPVRLELRGSCE